MTTIKFGSSCDLCGIAQNDYRVDTIRTCEDCDSDLCPRCATVTGHSKGVEADVDQQPTWVEGMCDGPTGPCELPLGHAGDHFRLVQLEAE